MTSNGRTLAIGDIHGCYRALDALLAAVGPTPDDLIITLGDYVDRGLDSAGVMNRMISLASSHRLVALRGNHEEMMLEARLSNAHLNLWLQFGGEATLISYAPGSNQPKLEDIPPGHWDFLENRCADYHQTETHIFVHGSVSPELPMEVQTTTVLRWQNFPPSKPHESGKIVVCGHTPQRGGHPGNIGHAICLDTGACQGGCLTCLDVGSGEIWQSNEAGKIPQRHAIGAAAKMVKINSEFRQDESRAILYILSKKLEIRILPMQAV